LNANFRPQRITTFRSFLEFHASPCLARKLREFNDQARELEALAGQAWLKQAD
jgi:hypothetical protein